MSYPRTATEIIDTEIEREVRGLVAERELPLGENQILAIIDEAKERIITCLLSGTSKFIEEEIETYS